MLAEPRSRQLWKKAWRLLQHMNRFVKLWEAKRPAEYSNLMITELIDEKEEGMVYKVVDRITGTIYALKEFNNYRLSDRQNIYNEIQALKRLNNPNLLKIHELFAIDQKIYLLLDYMDKGGGNNLFFNTKEFADESYLAYVAHQLLLGLDYLHSHNIAHAHFNTTNIFLHSSNQLLVKVSYFGRYLSPTPSSVDNNNNIRGGGVSVNEEEEKYYWDIWCLGLTILKLYTVSCANSRAHVHPQDTFYLKSAHDSPPPSKLLWSFLLCCMRRCCIAKLIRHPFIECHSKSFTKQKMEPLSAAPCIPLSFISGTTDVSSGRREQHSPDERPKFSVHDEKSIYHTEMTRNPTKEVDLSEEVYHRCINYCSLFPLDFQFEKDKLIQLWIAEECFEVELERMEVVANKYFDLLVEKQDILPSKFDHIYKEMKYKVNSTRALAWPLVEGYLRLGKGNLDQIPETTLHLSLHQKEFDPTTFDVLENCKQLHTLLLLGGHNGSIERLPHGLFLHLKLLKTLDLSFSHLSEVPSSIGILESLRFLDLSGTRIKELPESTTDLHNLQTLRLKGCFGVHELPAEFRKLTDLRHLDFDIIQQLESMPKGMGNLVNIRTLRGFRVGKNDECGITELKNMNNIGGSFHISRLENVQSVDDAKEAAIGNKKYMERLVFRWNGPGNENSETETDVLEHLQPHFGLKELEILAYRGVKLPSWINNPSFTELASITLHNCPNCHFLPSIGELPSLKFLKIFGMNSVIDINSLFRGSHGTLGCNAFPKLEKLILDKMICLEKWTTLEDGDLPCISDISIRYCPNLYILPVMSHLRALRRLEISHCKELVSLPEGRMPSSLESLYILECPKINKRCYKGEGQDCFKVAHVRRILIDLKEVSLD